MRIRPIRTEADCRAARERIADLRGAGQGSEEADELEVLEVLVGAYEEARDRIPTAGPIEAIRFRLEQSGQNRRDLEEILGVARGRVSEILNRKRGLSIRMIRRLVDGLDIPAEVLIRPTRRSG